MAKRLREYKEEERERITSDIEIAASRLGADRYSDNNLGDPPPKGFGLCVSCGSFGFSRSQFKIRRAVCDRSSRNPMQLSESDPIIECTFYYAKGKLSLGEMWEIAVFIDPPKNKIGMT